jgi:hypothetical protein
MKAIQELRISYPKKKWASTTKRRLVCSDSMLYTEILWGLSLGLMSLVEGQDEPAAPHWYHGKNSSQNPLKLFLNITNITWMN